MLKLSHLDYFLPTVEALGAGVILRTGTTLPQIVNGVCIQTGIKSDYVVKFIRSTRMSPEASARELIAALMARELDFTVPEPVVIHISEAFIETMQGNENFEVAANSLGFNFGNEYKTGYIPVLKDQTISGVLEAKLIDLYAFDLMISNADRRIEKPNFLTDGDDILIFDHELAFGFTLELPFLRNSEPWTIRHQDLNWIRDNFCFDRLKGKQFDFSGFQRRLEVIDNVFWNKIETILPAGWLTEQISDIKGYLNQLIAHADLFANELNRILL
ncbi:HipA family kinase [Mucilaginibacter endophyticus]|uniref:HipA family kinase n=1 Tax=Mucilaginibacter endophyticus TaxID=2675003 RepID=UPI000E0D7C39|nr:HipA family kinase [Mucilaginibacter endophyticus]